MDTGNSFLLIRGIFFTASDSRLGRSSPSPSQFFADLLEETAVAQISRRLLKAARQAFGRAVP